MPLHFSPFLSFSSHQYGVYFLSHFQKITFHSPGPKIQVSKAGEKEPPVSLFLSSFLSSHPAVLFSSPTLTFLSSMLWCLCYRMPCWLGLVILN